MTTTHPARKLVQLAAFTLVLFLTACGDEPLVPMDPEPPSNVIQDALNGTGGNPFVFLKPPVVDEPSSTHFGTFNGNVAVVVEICDTNDLDPDTGLCTTLLTTNDGTATPARYTLQGGPGGESIIVDLTEEEYQLPIHFALFDLADDSDYRIVTRIGSRVLAYADLLLVSPNEMENADTENNIVFTNDSKTLPWKFRIDYGALCWEPGETVVACTSETVTAGEETTVTLTSSDGEEVDFHLPAGWTATVDGQTVDELTISIEEVPADHGTETDPSCFANLSLNDPDTGEPSNCYDVRADTETESDVTVVFGTALPILAFCPDQEVLQAIADGAEGYIMTSVEQDAQGALRRTYTNVQPASDFGGCPLPTQTALGDGPIGQLASSVWQRIQPIVRPLLPRPLHAADLGFGGEIGTLSTIFFWSRTPADIAVTPGNTTLAVGQTVQLSTEPIFHDGALAGSSDLTIQWASSDVDVATVDASGVVTGVASGTAQITATATDVLDPSGTPLSGTATVDVETAVAGGLGTAEIDGNPETTSGEWANAACFPVTMNLPGGGSDPNAEFCFMNDGSNMYVRSTYTNTVDSSDPASTLFFELDMDGDGDVAADPGDDNLGQQQSGGSALSFRDEVMYDNTTFANVSCSTTCSADDTNLGGTIDGAGAYANANGTVTFEMSHPLASGDETANAEPLDVSLVAGDVILVRFRQSVHADTDLSGTTLTDLVTQVQIQSDLQ